MTPPLAPAEPAKRLTVVASENGWILDAHPESGPPFDGSGLAGTRYVYTSASELGAAVVGLVSTGEARTPPASSAVCNAYNNGLRIGRDELLGRQPWKEIDELQKKLTVATDKRGVAESEVARLTGVISANALSYEKGREDTRRQYESRSVFAEVTELLKKLAKSEAAVSSLTRACEHWEATQKMWSAGRATLEKNIVRLRKENNELDAERRRLQDEVRRTEVPPPSPPGHPYHAGEPAQGFRVGDVWLRHSGRTRLVVASVNRDEIGYHCESWDQEERGWGWRRYSTGIHNRGGLIRWTDLTQENATLVRK